MIKKTAPVTLESDLREARVPIQHDTNTKFNGIGMIESDSKNHLVDTIVAFAYITDIFRKDISMFHFLDLANHGSYIPRRHLKL